MMLQIVFARLCPTIYTEKGRLHDLTEMLHLLHLLHRNLLHQQIFAKSIYTFITLLFFWNMYCIVSSEKGERLAQVKIRRYCLCQSYEDDRRIGVYSALIFINVYIF